MAGLGGVSLRPNPLQPIPLPLPRVGTLSVSTSSFVVGEDGGHRPCAYVIFDITYALRAQGQGGVLPWRLRTDPGCLDDLRVAIDVSGPAVKLLEAGPSQCPTLDVGDRWVVLVKVGLRGGGLAARLTAKSTSIAMIDQMLLSLEDDSKKSEPVSVSAVVRYRQSLFPEDTTLETGSVCVVGPLTTTSFAAVLTDGDSSLGTSIIHALDPGHGQMINLQSIVRPDRQPPIQWTAEEAKNLIKDFTQVFHGCIPLRIETDLLNLEAFYHYRRRSETPPSEPSGVKKLGRRASNAMSKLSVGKNKDKDVA
jgi:hypothetical protein